MVVRQRGEDNRFRRLSERLAEGETVSGLPCEGGAALLLRSSRGETHRRSSRRSGQLSRTGERPRAAGYEWVDLPSVTPPSRRLSRGRPALDRGARCPPYSRQDAGVTTTSPPMHRRSTRGVYLIPAIHHSQTSNPQQTGAR